MISKLIDRAIARRHPFRSRAEILAEVHGRHDAVDQVIAERYTRGNVNIKRGAFTVGKDKPSRAKKKR